MSWNNSEKYVHKLQIRSVSFLQCLELSWDATLKMTGSVLELFTDIDIVQFTKKDMRDGVS